MGMLDGKVAFITGGSPVAHAGRARAHAVTCAREGTDVIILDIAWPESGVAVESDGWRVRSRSRGKFDQDRRKANLLAAAGWIVIHATSAMGDEEIREAVQRVLWARRTPTRPQRLA